MGPGRPLSPSLPGEPAEPGGPWRGRKLLQKTGWKAQDKPTKKPATVPAGSDCMA